MNDTEIIVTISRLAEFIGVTRKTLYNQLGSSITYELIIDYLDSRINEADEDLERLVNAKSIIEQIHAPVINRE